MADEALAPVDSTLFVVPTGYASEVAWAVLSYQMNPPRGTLMIIIVVLEMVMVGFGWTLSPLVVGFGVVALLMTVLAHFMVWFNTRRGVEANWVAGSTLKASFGRESFTVREGAVATTYRFDAVKSVQLWRGMVVLTLKARPLPSLYPAELFPDRVRGRFGNEPTVSDPDPSLDNLRTP